MRFRQVLSSVAVAATRAAAPRNYWEPVFRSSTALVVACGVGRWDGAACWVPTSVLGANP
jgi:hypothetical protein